MTPPQASSAGSAYTALAAEIAYDRALIAICTEHGIYAHATTFAYPIEERKRIEALLVEEGIDLDSPERRGGETPVAPVFHLDGAEAKQPRKDGRGADQAVSSRSPRRSATKSSGVAIDGSKPPPRIDLHHSGE